MTTSNARRAQMAVSVAIAKGSLVPAASLQCDQCGAPASDYHHHQGYAPGREFAVIPLCRSCHVKAHYQLPRKRRGPNKPKAPLLPPPRQAPFPLRRLRIVAGFSQRALAAAAGVGLRVISDIERGRTKHPHMRIRHALVSACGRSLDPVTGVLNDIRNGDGDTPASTPE